MRFTITRQNLHNGLAAVSASIPSKTTLPVLSNILFATDGDGVWMSGTDLDVAVSNNDQRAVLLRNDGGNAKHYLRLRLTGTRSNRDAIGAKVTVTAGGKKQVEEVRSGTSYLSQNELTLHFGLGAATKAEKVEIRWPSGKVQVLTGVQADQTLAVKEPASP